MFIILNFVRATGTAAAVNQMGARFAAGGDKLAEIVREHQVTGSRWQALDAALIEAVGKPPNERIAEAEESLRSELSNTDTRQKELALILGEKFPQYAEIANPQPSSVIEAQQLLGSTEAV